MRCALLETRLERIPLLGVCMVRSGIDRLRAPGESGHEAHALLEAT